MTKGFWIKFSVIGKAGLMLVTCAVIFSAGIGGISSVQATDAETDYRQDLDDVRSQIGKLTEQSVITKEQRSQIQKQLAELEQRSSKIRKRRHATEKKIAELDEKQKNLEREQKTQQAEIESLAVEFKAIMRASFAVSRLNYVKILLSESNPSRLARTAAYYKYMTRNRADQISHLRGMVAKLEKTETQIRANREQLSTLNDRLTRQQEQIRIDQNEKKKLVAVLNRNLQTGEQKIQDMKEIEARLLKLIKDLDQDATSDQQKKGRFAKMRGKLRLPLEAPIKGRFGQPKSIPGAKWRGLFLASANEQDVEAIFTGQVIYADVFQEFGWMAIIDHGDGFLSLYAHNAWLDVQVGDWVETGDVIAAAGDTGGLREPGLYFEILKNGKPVDPLLWCQGKNQIQG